jgi:RNA-directed DNA polymerase
MPKDAPPNGDAPTEEDLAANVPVGPWRRVSEMQADLHRWAAAASGLRCDGLFPTLGPRCLNQPTAETMESPVR